MKKNSIFPSNTTTSGTPPTVDIHLNLTVPDYGARFHVKKQTVWSWLRVGLPHLKLSPRKTIIPTMEADRWVHDRFFRQRQRQRR